MKTFEEYITEGLKITLGPAKFELETADKVEQAWHGLGKHNGKFSIFVNNKKKTVQSNCLRHVPDSPGFDECCQQEIPRRLFGLWLSQEIVCHKELAGWQ